MKPVSPEFPDRALFVSYDEKHGAVWMKAFNMKHWKYGATVNIVLDGSESMMSNSKYINSFFVDAELVAAGQPNAETPQEDDANQHKIAK